MDQEETKTELKIEHVPIGSLVEDPANVRKHGAKNLEAIKGSLARFGQQKPLVVGPRNVVVAGNGTLQAARSLGWEEIAVVRTVLDGVESTAFAIADNRTGELAEWDGDALATALESLAAEDLLDGVGFDEDELKKLLGGEDEPVAKDAPESFGEIDENINTDHECPRCGFEWS